MTYIPKAFHGSLENLPVIGRIGDANGFNQFTDEASAANIAVNGGVIAVDVDQTAAAAGTEIHKAVVMLDEGVTGAAVDVEVGFIFFTATQITDDSTWAAQAVRGPYGCLSDFGGHASIDACTMKGVVFETPVTVAAGESWYMAVWVKGGNGASADQLLCGGTTASKIYTSGAEATMPTKTDFDEAAWSYEINKSDLRYAGFTEDSRLNVYCAHDFKNLVDVFEEADTGGTGSAGQKNSRDFPWLQFRQGDGQGYTVVRGDYDMNQFKHAVLYCNCQGTGNRGAVRLYVPYHVFSANTWGMHFVNYDYTSGVSLAQDEAIYLYLVDNADKRWLRIGYSKNASNYELRLEVSDDDFVGTTATDSSEYSSSGTHIPANMTLYIDTGAGTATVVADDFQLTVTLPTGFDAKYLEITGTGNSGGHWLDVASFFFFRGGASALVIGDSTTDFYESVLAGYAPCTMMDRNASLSLVGGSNAYAPKPIINTSQGGSKINQVNVAGKLVEATSKIPAEFVIVSMGSNDISNGDTLATIKSDFDTLMTALNTYYGKMNRVIVCTVPIRREWTFSRTGAGDETADICVAFNDYLKGTARDNNGYALFDFATMLTCRHDYGFNGWMTYLNFGITELDSAVTLATVAEQTFESGITGAVVDNVANDASNFDTDLTDADGTWDDYTLVMTSGTYKGQQSAITTYVQANGKITLTTALGGEPSAGDAFKIVQVSSSHMNPLGLMHFWLGITQLMERIRASEGAVLRLRRVS